MANLTPRFTLPEKGNPYYNTKSNGGYSDAIVGKPTCPGLNVLANCVGQGTSRFHEIAEDKKMTLLPPINAEDIWYNSRKCEKGQTPRFGAVMCWAKGKPHTSSDGCGHICIVEEVVSDTEVKTSESGYNNPNFWYSKTRKKGVDGNWGQPKEYTFQGFIYNPVVPAPIDYRQKVRTYQMWLNATYNLHLTIDGYAGQKTKEASVIGLQTELNYLGENLEIDGKFGKLTGDALNRHTIQKGVRGGRAMIVQGLLYAHAYNCNGLDGSVGDGCDKAIRLFQEKHNLVVDGKVGKETFTKLLE